MSYMEGWIANGVTITNDVFSQADEVSFLREIWLLIL